MKLLITGIVMCVLPILTWFSGEGFVPIAGTTLFFWVIGIPMILIGADRMRPEGIWKTKGQGSGGSSSGTEYERHYNYDAKGNLTGWTETPKK